MRVQCTHAHHCAGLVATLQNENGTARTRAQPTQPLPTPPRDKPRTTHKNPEASLFVSLPKHTKGGGELQLAAACECTTDLYATRCLKHDTAPPSTWPCAAPQQQRCPYSRVHAAADTRHKHKLGPHMKPMAVLKRGTCHRGTPRTAPPPPPHPFFPEQTAHSEGQSPHLSVRR